MVVAQAPKDSEMPSMQSEMEGQLSKFDAVSCTEKGLARYINKDPCSTQAVSTEMTESFTLDIHSERGTKRLPSLNPTLHIRIRQMHIRLRKLFRIKCTSLRFLHSGFRGAVSK